MGAGAGAATTGAGAGAAIMGAGAGAATMGAGAGASMTSGGSAAGASLTKGDGAGAKTGGMPLQPVLRNLQQSRGVMQPGAPEDPVQHVPWPCTQSQQSC